MFRIKNPSLYLVFLSLLGATPPLATDMYLAAIPRIAEDWNVDISLINLSLVLWFASFSVSLLVFGPISDKYGRRPVLLSGLLIFVLSSLLCGVSTNAHMLIAFRVLQGLGAAAPSAMVMAICRDKFTGADRQKALAYIGVILAVAPMVAPSIGSFLLGLGSWRLIFFTQASMVFVTLMIALGFEETAAELNPSGIFSAFARYKKLLLLKEYAAATTVMGLSAAPLLGFIAFSPIAYMKVFGLSEHHFSIIFGINAVFVMTGSLLSAKLSVRMSQAKILTVAFFGSFIGGLCVYLFGSLDYRLFAGSMFIYSFFLGLNRPVSASLVLEQVKSDIGAASSFLIFYQFLVGAFCMWVVTRSYADPMAVYGMILLFVPLAVLVVWPFLFKWLRKNGGI